jgi:hypothetical protein
MEWQRLVSFHDTFFANQLKPEATLTLVCCGKITGTIRAALRRIIAASFKVYQFLKVCFTQR